MYVFMLTPYQVNGVLSIPGLLVYFFYLFIYFLYTQALVIKQVTEAAMERGREDGKAKGWLLLEEVAEGLGKGRKRRGKRVGQGRDRRC